MTDIQVMSRALLLAKKGSNHVFPNPRVGCVVIKNSKVIGEGWHAEFGGKHAEIIALDQAGSAAKGATVFVTLEPHNYTSKTKPCTDALIKAEVKKVVIAMPDPNPNVSGSGIQQLTEAGIEVKVGLLEAEARELNKQFVTFHEKKRPFIALKWAQTTEGKLHFEDGKQHWITGEKTRKYARALRADYQAILVGVGTVLSDNPHLGVRDDTKKDPLRITLDSNLQSPPDAKVFRDDNYLLATANIETKNVVKYHQPENLLRYSRSEKIGVLLHVLYKKGVTGVFVEGGERVLRSFIEEGLYDEVHIFVGDLNGVTPKGDMVEKISKKLTLQKKDRIGVDGYFKFN